MPERPLNGISVIHSYFCAVVFDKGLAPGSARPALPTNLLMALSKANKPSCSRCAKAMTAEELAYKTGMGADPPARAFLTRKTFHAFLPP